MVWVRVWLVRCGQIGHRFGGRIGTGVRCFCQVLEFQQKRTQSLDGTKHARLVGVRILQGGVPAEWWILVVMPQAEQKRMVGLHVPILRIDR